MARKQQHSSDHEGHSRKKTGNHPHLPAALTKQPEQQQQLRQQSETLRNEGKLKSHGASEHRTGKSSGQPPNEEVDDEDATATSVSGIGGSKLNGDSKPVEREKKAAQHEAAQTNALVQESEKREAAKQKAEKQEAGKQEAEKQEAEKQEAEQRKAEKQEAEQQEAQALALVLLKQLSGQNEEISKTLALLGSRLELPENESQAAVKLLAALQIAEEKKRESELAADNANTGLKIYGLTIHLIAILGMLYVATYAIYEVKTFAAFFLAVLFSSIGLASGIQKILHKRTPSDDKGTPHARITEALIQRAVKWISGKK